MRSMRLFSTACAALVVGLAAPAALAQAPAPGEPAEATDQPPSVEEPPPPETMAVGDKGYFEPGLLMQGWFLLGRQASETTSTFRVRRAEIKVQGEIIPDTLAYKVMVDPAKLLSFNRADVPVEGQDPPPANQPGTVSVATEPRDASILQDFYITYLTDFADVSLGQFKIPLSWEGYNSSSKLILPERSLVADTYGDRRDVGVRVEKKFEYFKYMAGVFNGTGRNELDDNNQKDVSLRLEAYPVNGLMVGAVGYLGVGQRDEPGTKDRVEGDVRVEMYDALLQAEYIRGWDQVVVDQATGATDRIEGHGFYVAAGYTFFDRLQPIVRVGYLDQNLDENIPAANEDDDEVWEYGFGLNYYILENQAKLQSSYTLYDYEDYADRGELILSAQLSF